MATNSAIRLLVNKLAVPCKYRLGTGYKEELEKLKWNLEITLALQSRLQDGRGEVVLDAADQNNNNNNAPPRQRAIEDVIIRIVTSIVCDTNQLLALCDQYDDHRGGGRGSRRRRRRSSKSKGSSVAGPVIKSIRLVVCMLHQYTLGQRVHRLNQRFKEFHHNVLLMHGLGLLQGCSLPF